MQHHGHKRGEFIHRGYGFVGRKPKHVASRVECHGFRPLAFQGIELRLGVLRWAKFVLFDCPHRRVKLDGFVGIFFVGWGRFSLFPLVIDEMLAQMVIVTVQDFVEWLDV